MPYICYFVLSVFVSSDINIETKEAANINVNTDTCWIILNCLSQRSNCNKVKCGKIKGTIKSVGL